MDEIEKLVTELIEEDTPAQLKLMGLSTTLTPQQTLWRAMTSKQVRRIINRVPKTESFSSSRVIAEEYIGPQEDGSIATLYRGHVVRPNQLFKMDKYGVQYLTKRAFETLEALRYTLSPRKNGLESKAFNAERLNCLTFIFRMIMATGCGLTNHELHEKIFRRLGFEYDYDIILGTNPKNPSAPNLALYREIKKWIGQQIDDCVRHSYYWVDSPLINDYITRSGQRYRFTLPGMLKPLGIDGVVFYFDDDGEEIMIFSGPENPINITPQLF